MEEVVSWQKKDYIYILVASIVAFFISLQDVCSPISKIINYSDGSIYQYIGHLICIGKMPYVNAFDHKGPVLYLINALSFLLGQHGIWLIDLLFMVLYVVMAYRIARKYVDSCWSFVISICLSIALSGAYWIGNTPDWYASVAIMYCVLLFAEYCHEGGLSDIKVCLVGVMLAFCFWQKFTTIVVIGVLSLGIMVLDFVKTKSIKFSIKCIIFALLGFSAATMPIILWLWRGKAIGTMITDYFLFSTSYGTEHVAIQERCESLIFFCTDRFILLSLIGIACFFFFCLVLGIKKNTRHAIIMNGVLLDDIISDVGTASVCVCSFALQAIVNALTGRQYVQYKLVLYPCSFLLMCIFLKFVLTFSRKLHIKCLVLILLGVCAAYNLNDAFKNQKELSNFAKISEFDEIKKYMMSGENIAVATPDDCGLYLNTGTESATQYPYLQVDLYGSDDFWRVYNDQLRQNPAAVIVWSNNWDANYYLSGDILSEYDRVDLGRLAIYERRNVK